MNQIGDQVFERLSLLDESDLCTIRTYVEERVQLITSKHITDLEYYHLSHSEFHHLLAKKSAREFSHEVVSNILQLPSIRFLMSRFEGYSIDQVIDENGIAKRPEIYFRIVRPNAVEDVGCPHMDTWYHQVAGLGHRSGTTYKVWISLSSEPGLSGLNFFPDADVLNVHWTSRGSSILCDTRQTSLGKAYLPNVASGDCFIFRDDVLHVGALNRGNTTRVSAEITLVPDKI
jgi:hypothetical protein